MARLWSSGFELNSTTAGVEFDSISGAVSVSTTHVRTGMYALRSNPVASTFAFMTYSFSTSNPKIIYGRFYLYIATLPTVSTIIFGYEDTTFADAGSIKLTTTGILQLWDNDNNVQIGSNSNTLNTGQWYRIELFQDMTTVASTINTALIDGVQFATGTTNQTGVLGASKVLVGVANRNATSCDLYFDDVAINDNSGSFQNTYPGDGSIVHLKPNAAGDATNWTPNAGTNFSQVQEITPDDATTFVSDALTGKSDLYNVENAPPSLHPSSPVTLVSVGGRFNNPTADATTSFQFQIEKVSGGTITKSSAITPNSTTWSTNAVAIPRVYPLTLYQDPDSINWTTDTISQMQIGVLTGTIGIFGIQLSTIWALVEYIPASSLPNYGKYITVGNGSSRSEVAN